MKLFIIILCLTICNVGFSQLSRKEERIYRKAERLYDKKKEWKAINKIGPVLKKNISEPRLWLAMIKYKIAGYLVYLDENDYESLSNEKEKLDNVIVIDSSLDAQLESILKKLYRTLLYEELVQLLEDADKNCESIEPICEYIDRIKFLGQEKVMQGKKIISLFEKHQQTIEAVKENNCQ